MTKIVAGAERVYWILDDGGTLHTGYTEPGQVTETGLPVARQTTDVSLARSQLTAVRHRLRQKDEGFIVVDDTVVFRELEEKPSR
jgi:hypothetical protein